MALSETIPERTDVSPETRAAVYALIKTAVDGTRVDRRIAVAALEARTATQWLARMIRKNRIPGGDEHNRQVWIDVLCRYSFNHMPETVD